MRGLESSKVNFAYQCYNVKLAVVRQQPKPRVSAAYRFHSKSIHFHCIRREKLTPLMSTSCWPAHQRGWHQKNTIQRKIPGLEISYWKCCNNQNVYSQIPCPKAEPCQKVTRRADSPIWAGLRSHYFDSAFPGGGGFINHKSRLSQHNRSINCNTCLACQSD